MAMGHVLYIDNFVFIIGCFDISAQVSPFSFIHLTEESATRGPRGKGAGIG